MFLNFYTLEVLVARVRPSFGMAIPTSIKAKLRTRLFTLESVIVRFVARTTTQTVRFAD